jgi:hypothetical protein
LLLKDQQPGNCDFQAEVDFLKQTMEIATRHNLLMTVGNNSRDCTHVSAHPTSSWDKTDTPSSAKHTWSIRKVVYIAGCYILYRCNCQAYHLSFLGLQLEVIVICSRFSMVLPAHSKVLGFSLQVGKRKLCPSQEYPPPAHRTSHSPISPCTDRYGQPCCTRRSEPLQAVSFSSDCPWADRPW